MRLASLKMGFVAVAGLIAACTPKEERTDCCAIEPKAKCESQLHGAGISRAEVDALKVDGGICPSSTLSEARIREIAKAAETPECQTMFGRIDLSRMDRGACAIAPAAITDGPAPH